MNLLVGALFVITIVLLGVIAKLRSDLCYARWVIYRLTFMLLAQEKTEAEYWEATDPQKLGAYAEGQITLQELFKHIRENYP